MTAANYGINADTYTVTASSSLGWADLSAIPNSFSLSPGISATVPITVHVPFSATQGMTDVLHLAAFSLNDPGLEDESTTETSVTPDCINPFVDISGNIFYGAIHYLNCAGAVNGTDATHFSPGETSTRAQFAKVVVLGFGLRLTTPISAHFTDVPPTYYAHVYIESGYAYGILSGFDQNSCTAHGAIYPCYLPNLAITRGQLTKLVVNAAGYAIITPPTPSFTDVPRSNVFYSAIEAAHSKGVINGYPDGTFRPNNPIRRDEMCQIVYKGVTTP